LVDLRKRRSSRLLRVGVVFFFFYVPFSFTQKTLFSLDVGGARAALTARFCACSPALPSLCFVPLFSLRVPSRSDFFFSVINHQSYAPPPTELGKTPFNASPFKINFLRCHREVFFFQASLEFLSGLTSRLASSMPPPLGSFLPLCFR